MGVVVWEGDATATAQVDTLTVAGTWVASETLTTELTAEDGSTTQQVQTTVSTTTATEVRDEHLSELQSNTQSLFQKITWASSGSAAITATAKIAGEPFAITDPPAETSAAGTYTRAATTASSGPHDWGVAANWDGAAVPVSTDEVKFTTGSSDVLYSLNQSSVNLNSFEIGAGYSGSIGQPSNSYYLQIDVNNAGSDALIMKGSGDSYWINGTIPNVQIERSSASTKAIMLDGDIDDLYIIGPGVRGTIDIKSGTVLDTVHMIGTANAKLIINASVTNLDDLYMNGGECENSSNIPLVDLVGGKYTQKGTVTNTGVTSIWGGTFRHHSSGTMTNIKQYGGVFNVEESEAGAFAITNTVTVYGGLFQALGPVKITYNGSPEVNKFGGIVNASATVAALPD